MQALDDSMNACLMVCPRDASGLLCLALLNSSALFNQGTTCQRLNSSVAELPAIAVRNTGRNCRPASAMTLKACTHPHQRPLTEARTLALSASLHLVRCLLEDGSSLLLERIVGERVCLSPRHTVSAATPAIFTPGVHSPRTAVWSPRWSRIWNSIFCLPLRSEGKTQAGRVKNKTQQVQPAEAQGRTEQGSGHARG